MLSTGELGVLMDQDYPGLFQSADAASGCRQRTYVRAVRVRLILSVAAAVFAAFSLRVGAAGIEVFAVATALAFVGVMAIELAVAGSRPDKTWFEGRALAESVKSLTWRYMTVAAPFTGERADEEFVERLRTLQRDIPEMSLLPSTAPAISDRMRAVRAAPLGQRREIYLVGRVLDQQNWYASKAVHHQRHARVFWVATVVMEVVGITGALAKAFGLVDFDLAGIVAAVVSSLVAWNSTRQHNATATAYVMAAHELTMIRDQLTRDIDEQHWSAAVIDAEAAISREHTMWHANRTK